jgi:F-type H+/Na+-transporting ATPase subunit alpha
MTTKTIHETSSKEAKKTNDIVEELKRQIASFKDHVSSEETGRVREVGDGIVKASGLSNVGSMEMVEFEDGSMGFALNLEEDQVGILVLGDTKGIREGGRIKATGKILSVPVGKAVTGRVLDPLGRALDGGPEIPSKTTYPVEKVAPRVMTRERVSQPLMTGLKAIDAMIPIGRGQRELIIGDRQTGKTAIAIDTILNQKGQNVHCVYVAIGQKESKVAKLMQRLKDEGAMAYTTIVSAGASDPAALQFIAPYAGCAISEWFMDQGEDVLIIYDDLSKHAWAYREASLLLRRPPGREAYPGDVFYLHSRLLERSARRNKESGGGSITALPIIETQAGDVSAYIPTNVISITDGQIYLESDLFYKGIRPAVNVGLSVSRVGGDAQTKAMKKVAGQLRLDLAQFRELEAFSQFATDLDETTRRQIERGRRTVEILKQVQYAPMDVAHEVIVIYAATKGFADAIPVEKMMEWEKGLHDHLESSADDLLSDLREKKALDDELNARIESTIKEWNAIFERL